MFSDIEISSWLSHAQKAAQIVTSVASTYIAWRFRGFRWDYTFGYRLDDHIKTAHAVRSDLNMLLASRGPMSQRRASELCARILPLAENLQRSPLPVIKRSSVEIVAILAGPRKIKSLFLFREPVQLDKPTVTKIANFVAQLYEALVHEQKERQHRALP